MGTKLRTGDRLLVIAGNDRGRTGALLRFKGEDRVVVEGVNVRKKHVKKSQAHPQGRILDVEAPIHISNVRPCTAEGQPVKLRVRRDQQGKKQLYFLNAEGKEEVYRVEKGSKKK